LSLSAAASPGDATGRFVDHALGLDWAAIAEPARLAAKTFLHDSLCVGAAGARAPNSDAILSVARSWGEGGGVTVLGRPGVRLPAASAAFVNGFQIHCQEFDCVHEGAVLHPVATSLAALKAEAERGGPYDGQTFLTALVAGVDIAVALGLAPTTPLKFFRPATAGVFGATAALARLRGLDRATTLDAFGYALAFCSGTMQAHVEGKPALPVQVANAARAALAAVDLAVAGLKGAQASLDGPYGYLPLFETAYDLEPVLEALAGTRRIAELSWKPFPTGRAAQGGLVGVGELVRAHGLGPDDLDTLVLSAPPLIERLVGRRPSLGMDVAYARLCFAWLAAVALTKGEVGLADFTPDRLADPELLALAQRVTVVKNAVTDPAAFTPLTLTARTRSGREIEIGIDAMLGSPAHPLSREQHLEKARRCLAHAGLEAQHAPLIDAIETLDQAPDVAPTLRIAADPDPKDARP
jgi:2-methylcitrate dehydratase PrpD